MSLCVRSEISNCTHKEVSCLLDGAQTNSKLTNPAPRAIAVKHEISTESGSSLISHETADHPSSAFLINIVGVPCGNSVYQEFPGRRAKSPAVRLSAAFR